MGGLLHVSLAFCLPTGKRCAGGCGSLDEKSSPAEVASSPACRQAAHWAVLEATAAADEAAAEALARFDSEQQGLPEGMHRSQAATPAVAEGGRSRPAWGGRDQPSRRCLIRLEEEVLLQTLPERLWGKLEGSGAAS